MTQPTQTHQKYTGSLKIWDTKPHTSKAGKEGVKREANFSYKDVEGVKIILQWTAYNNSDLEEMEHLKSVADNRHCVLLLQHELKDGGEYIDNRGNACHKYYVSFNDSPVIFVTGTPADEVDESVLQPEGAVVAEEEGDSTLALIGDDADI